jgi:hypothetical protein
MLNWKSLVFQILTMKLLIIFVGGIVLVLEECFRESIITVPHYTDAHEMHPKEKEFLIHIMATWHSWGLTGGGGLKFTFTVSSLSLSGLKHKDRT